MLFEKSLIKNFMQQNLQINLKSVAVESFTFLNTEGFVYSLALDKRQRVCWTGGKQATSPTLLNEEK